jgi:hypothetical protein
VSGSIVGSTGALRFGGDSIWGEYFNGLIDEVRIYSLALTAAQIQADMNTPVGSPQLAAEGSAPGGSAPVLTAAELAPIAAEAVRRWAAAGLDADQVAALDRVRFQIADLGPAGDLALTPVGGRLVVLDDDGAGRGWYVDPTPADDAEFGARLTPTEARAAAGPAAGRYDLLTVVMHELGHVLGLDDLDPAAAPHDLLTATLPTGTRRLPDPVPQELHLAPLAQTPEVSLPGFSSRTEDALDDHAAVPSVPAPQATDAGTSGIAGTSLLDRDRFGIQLQPDKPIEDGIAVVRVTSVAGELLASPPAALSATWPISPAGTDSTLGEYRTDPSWERVSLDDGWESLGVEL